MKPLSDSLMELAQRVKRLEDSSVATQADDGQYEHRRTEIDEAIERELRAFEAARAEVGSSVRPRRSTGRRPLERHVEPARSGTRHGPDEGELERAMRTAEIAEQDARAAIALARYSLNSAEYAVLDAALARAEAASLAGDATVLSASDEATLHVGQTAREGGVSPASSGRGR